MPTSCPPPDSCATAAQVWLDTKGRDVFSLGNATVEACVSWGFHHADDDPVLHNSVLADCCLFTLPVTVRNCGDFNVYYLSPTQGCSIAYCSAPGPIMRSSAVSLAVKGLLSDVVGRMSKSHYPVDPKKRAETICPYLNMHIIF